MSNITLTIPNDDSVALYHFGKSLISMSATIDGAPDWVVIAAQEYDRLKQLEELSQAQHIKVNIDSSDIEQLSEALKKVEPTGLIHTDVVIDTTAQQVESLAVPMGDNEEQAPPTTDSTGTPWDERIHSASKALNADGTWRLRRKPKDMDEAEWSDYVSMIKADLQYPVECGGEGEEISEPTREEVDELIEASNKMLEPPVTPPGDDFHTDADVVTEQTVAGIPPIPVPPPVVVAPSVTEWDFPRLMTFLTERHGKIDVTTVNTLLAQDGMSSVQELNAHPDKIGPFVARVKAHLGE
jgi:hypothetical protein|nr:MAG TPA: hypothetical protein [Caudoviricetes sp.]